MEVWKTIPGYEGSYEVSNMGNVRSLDRVTKSKNQTGSIEFKTKGKILVKCIDIQKQYNGVSLCKDGVIKKVRVCRMVAKEFVPNPHNKPFVNHINGIKTDDRAINLEWCTPMENSQHASKNGLLSISQPKRLDEHDRNIIFSSKESCIRLANKFDVCIQTIYNIKNQKYYSLTPKK